MRIFLSAAVIFLLHDFCYSQGIQKLEKEKKYVSVGLGVNANQYFGDLHAFAGGNIAKTSRYRPGVTLFLEKKISPHVGLSAALSWNRIAGDDFYNADPREDPFQYTRNLSFRNDIFEFAAVAKYYFKKNEYTYAERPAFSPYVFVGAGLFYHNPKARIPEFAPDGQRFANGGEWRSLRDLGTEGQHSEHYDLEPYALFQPALPFGLGAQMKVNKNFSVNLEVCYRYIFTDYLDDVSGNYADLGALNSALAKVFSDRSQEVNSSNGRYPRNFPLIDQFTEEKMYQSAYDGRFYEVLDGFGEEGMKRGDDSRSDFYLMAGIRLTYILSGKKEKHNEF